MASYSVAKSTHKTLVAGTADAVTLTGGWAFVEVLNRAGSADLYVTNDGSVPTGGCENCEVVPAGTALKIACSDSSGVEVVGIVGNGNAYSVVGTNSEN